MQFLRLRRSTIAASVALLAGCATTAPGQKSDALAPLRQTFASDDPCANNSRNIGILGGALVGALLGNAIGSGKSESKLVGAALGGLVGGLIGADMDRKRCELSKVAKQYNLDISYADIRAEGNVQAMPSPEAQGPQAAGVESPPPDSAKSAGAVIGNTVTVRDKDGAAGHFETNSDKLTPKAQEYFAAIAAQYAPETLLASQTGAQQKEDARKQLAQRRILLVGHTDDTGASRLNADLSERRARAVAAFLKTKGVPETSLYYQGAGETLPMADNRSDEGRAANRRVEIVELASENGFQKYLEARKPQYAFYRPAPNALPSTDALPATAATTTNAITPLTGKAAKPSPKAAPPAPDVQTAKAATGWDFGGLPYSPRQAKLDTGSHIPERGFSLISQAHADDSVLLADCSFDRPRNVGNVKSLRDGSAYKTSEHLPQLYGKTWATDVNGHLVVINRLAVLRSGGVPAHLPELKVYAHYKPGNGKKADVQEEPQVNSYLVDKGVLYRMFPKEGGGMKCMDVLFALDGSTAAKAGKLIYAHSNKTFVADFKPQLQ